MIIRPDASGARPPRNDRVSATKDGLVHYVRDSVTQAAAALDPSAHSLRPTLMPIPKDGNRNLNRPLWARLPEEMGDLLLPTSMAPIALPGAAVVRIHKLLTACKSQVVHVDLVNDDDGRPRRIGDVGTNPLFLCRYPDGEGGVFKSMEPVDEAWITRMKDETAREIVASRLMKELGVDGITYRSAVATVDGDEHEGVVSEFVDHRTLLHDPALVDSLADPAAAIRGSILDAWMGNFDRIVNDGNVWVRPDGSVVYGDYGCTFRKGVTACGVPKVNNRLFTAHASADNVDPVLAQIRRLTDRQIEKMVDRAAAFATMLSPSQRDKIVDVLKANRDELKAGNPFEGFYRTDRPRPVVFPFTMEAGRAVARSAMIRFGADQAAPEVIAFRVTQNIRGYEPMHGDDICEVRDTIAGLIRCERRELEAEALIRPQHFIAWQQVCKLLLTPERSLELRLGLQ